MMMRFFLVLFAYILVTSWPALGDSRVALSFGPSLDGGTNPKYAALGYEQIYGEVSLLGECSGIFESPLNGDCGLVFSARVSTPSGLFIRVGVGPSYALHTDDRLSSPFEFNLQGIVGLTAGGVDIGAKFQHFSNAGIVPPNPGRDFLAAVVEFRP